MMTNSIARKKGYQESWYFWIGFFFGYFGLVYAAGLPIAYEMQRERDDRLIREFLKAQKENAEQKPNAPKRKAVVRSEEGNAADPNLPPSLVARMELFENAEAQASVSKDEVVCPKCGTSQKKDRQSCWNCGAELVQNQLDWVVPSPSATEGCVICPVCGKEQPADRRRCWTCGVEFRAKKA